ncbi:EAL domain, c-di-GMP-specific phosphodiesterase class I (or its enzymatically inactive variant) [Friedmanniella luteola]|uniref:EAL domain, c-di-GMP-specific phosphodiesterase class I (Or its enzymatically inactive variant) n=1 Tax=Friedmanniella luteola TaxID=546871 RepID=A0A1H1RHL9_9ACTN|nr:EAL domain-containing protein [Friedmanniella luteola]SDS35046.1 EAL domain, c-di-GMP-specific phosphodiesterase class I (or its enzymatically inactive variant) [Friedmanniella luteola]
MTIPTSYPARPSATAVTIDAVLTEHRLRTVWQPIVALEDRSVVAYEALTRGPAGTELEGPIALFDAARAAGRLGELDRACRSAALTAALEQGLFAPLHLFVNVEPEVLDSAPATELAALAHANPRLLVVLEITERALAARPAELLSTVSRVRELGWRVALDDVGANPAALAFMEILRPDVVKLDLRLVQDRPSRAIAEIMNAVNAYAERSGALLLAEGIETEPTARPPPLSEPGWVRACSSAAQLPTRKPAPAHIPAPLRLPSPPIEIRSHLSDSPFAALPIGTALRIAPKKLLIELSKQLEREALRPGPHR